jgi:hypothetical protein
VQEYRSSRHTSPAEDQDDAARGRRGRDRHDPEGYDDHESDRREGVRRPGPTVRRRLQLLQHEIARIVGECLDRVAPALDQERVARVDPDIPDPVLDRHSVLADGQCDDSVPVPEVGRAQGASDQP